MRIPIDYYRVLGVPPQATTEQLIQSYEDRRMQFPRREYSDGAISARQALLEQAYDVLCDPVKRLTYDQQFFSPFRPDLSYPEVVRLSLETEIPEGSSIAVEESGIEIDPQNLAGALIILAELGEYEIVTDLGEKTLKEALERPIDHQEDIYLSLALGYLERSREQWQRHSYEAAAELGHKGLNWLKNTDKFAKVQQELQKELYWLRPYRILERLAHPLANAQSRQTGLTLLGEMLEERQGIDGTGEDHSGLNVDDFLRFIQQLRIYLTVNEQLSLFQAEANRPSLVATYLAVYALIAQGVSARNPHAIVQAKNLLEILNKRQDVSLEKAICALLLGQTKTANDALKNCQDSSSLEFIRQQSQGSPDLLPGLYAYSKQWLEKEVFANFRDLAPQKVSLTEYFADEAVVSYLDSYLEDSSEPIPESLSDLKQPVGVTMANALSDQSYPVPSRRSGRRRSPSSNRYSDSSRQRPSTAPKFAPEAIPSLQPEEFKPESLIHPPDKEKVVITTSYRQPPTQSPPRRRPKGKGGPSRHQTLTEPAVVPLKRKKKGRRKAKVKIRPLLFLIGTVGGLGLLGFGIASLQASRSPVSELEPDAVLVQLTESPVEIPPENARLILPKGELNQEGAQEIIEIWLDSKAKALGSEHQIEEIGKILSGSLASTWENRARKLKNTDSYWKYDHKLEVKSVKTSPNSVDQAIIDARVKEVGDFYENGQVNRRLSYQDDLNVRYTVARRNGQWMIQEVKILP